MLGLISKRELEDCWSRFFLYGLDALVVNKSRALKKCYCYYCCCYYYSTTTITAFEFFWCYPRLC